MPKTQVREAIAAYLDPLTSGIAYLGAVYQALPKVTNESDLFNLQPSGTGIGAVIYMFIEGQVESRKALGGGPPTAATNSGRKLREYTLGLLCILKSDFPDSLSGQVAFDQFIDSLTAYIQADRYAGDPTVIFGWGEGNLSGGPDLRFDYPVPKTMSGGVTLFQGVGRVTVLEFLDT